MPKAKKQFTSVEAASRRSKSKGIDHELEVGALAHYEDPLYYEHAYGDRREDVEYYAQLAVDNGGPVLEYGAGSGRIALAIAQRGVDVTAVDWSAPMLAQLKASAKAGGTLVRKRVHPRKGDMRTLALRQRFPLVISTFNTFLHLYTRHDVEQFLARVRSHLLPAGRFVFDTSVPCLEDLVLDPARSYRIPEFRHPTFGVRCRYAERFDYDPIRQALFITMEFEPAKSASAKFETFVTPLAHRQFFPAELEALLHYNGFDVESCAGGFKGEPLDRHTETQVWTCVAQASRKTRPRA